MANMFHQLYKRRRTDLRRSDEDYCTEILAIILNGLSSDYPQQHEKLLRALGLGECAQQGIRWLTQQSRPGVPGARHPRFDILALDGLNVVGAIEVKKDAPLDEHQLHDYQLWLAQFGRKGHKFLCSITISGRGPDLAITQNVSYFPISWSTLSEAVSSVKRNVPRYTLLIEQAVGFWESWKMSNEAPRYDDFITTKKSDKSRSKISFLLEGSYDDIASIIREGDVDSEQSQHEGGVRTDLGSSGMICWRAAQRSGAVWVGWGFIWNLPAPLFENIERDVSDPCDAFVLVGIERDLPAEKLLSLQLPDQWQWSETSRTRSYAATFKPIKHFLGNNAADGRALSDWIIETYKKAKSFVDELVELA